MLDDEKHLSLLQATIASFRYWVPAISDTARVTESEAAGIWTLSVRPLQVRACPFSLTLTRDGRYAMTVDGVEHALQPVQSLNMFLPLAEAIADGRVWQRRWVSSSTGAELQVETIVDLGRGQGWSAVRPSELGRLTGLDDAICQDQHFLPFRRD